MSARILLALAVGLLIFAGEQHSSLAQSMLGVPGFQQQPQQEHPCQAEFNKLRDDIQNKGKALQDAGKRKVSAKELCARVVSYSRAETNMLNFFTQRGQECGVPPEASEGLKKSRTKTAELRTRICEAAKNPGPVPQSPSAGLSKAVNPNAGAVPETPAGGGIFDTLSGNVLTQ